jgi:hypothetical protein
VKWQNQVLDVVLIVKGCVIIAIWKETRTPDTPVLWPDSQILKNSNITIARASMWLSWKQCMPLLLPLLSCTEAMALRSVSKESRSVISYNLAKLSARNSKLLLLFPNITLLTLQTM